MNRLRRGLFTLLSAGMMMLLAITPVFAQENWQDGFGTQKGDLSAKAEVNNTIGVERIEGENRYLTSINVSKSGWTEANTVVLARGNDFADALASAPLAHKYGGPILLTPSNKLLDSTKAELERLGVTKVIIAGGKTAVSSTVEASIREMGINITRFAGSDRYETAALIADELNPEGGTVFIVNGLNFPDAISAAPHAAVAGIPILLTRPDSLPEVTKQKILAYDPFIFVIGGTSVIRDKAWFEIPGIDKFRIGGEDRYATNIMMAQAGGLEKNHMFVATGLDYADALTGAVLAAKQETGLLLVRQNKVPGVVADYIQGQGLTGITIFGGEDAVSQDVSRELNNLLQ